MSERLRACAPWSGSGTRPAARVAPGSRLRPSRPRGAPRRGRPRSRSHAGAARPQRSRSRECGRARPIRQRSRPESLWTTPPCTGWTPRPRTPSLGSAERPPALVTGLQSTPSASARPRSCGPGARSRAIHREWTMATSCTLPVAGRARLDAEGRAVELSVRRAPSRRRSTPSLAMPSRHTGPSGRAKTSLARCRRAR